jgi:hypothetical protein
MICHRLAIFGPVLFFFSVGVGCGTADQGMPAPGSNSGSGITASGSGAGTGSGTGTNGGGTAGTGSGNAGNSTGAAITGSAGSIATGTGSTGAAMTGSTGATTSGSPGASGGTGASASGSSVGSGVASGSGGGSSDAGVRTRPSVLSFAKDIAPIIQSTCSPCHTTQAKGGYNYTYDNLVTHSDVTDMNAASDPLSPCGKPSLTPGAPNLQPGTGSNAACDLPDLTLGTPRKRIVPGANWEWSVLWVKINLQSEGTCTHYCGGEMPPPSSGKTLTTFDRDTIKIWIAKGALP